MLFCVYSGGNINIQSETLSEVLRYDPADDQWQKTGDLETQRHSHGASSVHWDVIAPFCTTTTTTTPTSITTTSSSVCETTTTTSTTTTTTGDLVVMFNKKIIYSAPKK